MFRRYDKDKSGRLTAKELGPLGRRFNMTGKELLKAIDQSNDGYIEFREFARYMRKKVTEDL